MPGGSQAADPRSPASGWAGLGIQLSKRQLLPPAAGCNGRWVQALCAGLPIFYSSPVREIRHCASGAPPCRDSRCCPCCPCAVWPLAGGPPAHR